LTCSCGTISFLDLFLHLLSFSNNHESSSSEKDEGVSSQVSLMLFHTFVATSKRTINWEDLFPSKYPLSLFFNE
jgi:hypothetical protein